MLNVEGLVKATLIAHVDADRTTSQFELRPRLGIWGRRLTPSWRCS